MAFTLQNSINFAQPFVDYVPLNAGLGQEPASSVASIIINTLLQPPQTWPFNRNEISFNTVVGQQDYPVSFASQTPFPNDFGFVEKLTLTNDAGQIIEIKDVYNNSALSKSSEQQRPSAVSVHKIVGTNGSTQTVTFRFMGVPDAIYSATVTYQMLIPQFGPYFVTSAANHVASNTTYTGTYDPFSLQAGGVASFTGFTNAANNGQFTIVSCTTTSLVVANGAGVSETPTGGAFVVDFSWSPIPDQYSDIYNNLFLAEILAYNDDPREQLYRQRGIAAFLSKADGLTEMQRNAFLDQWLSRGRQRASTLSSEQLATRGRSV